MEIECREGGGCEVSRAVADRGSASPPTFPYTHCYPQRRAADSCGSILGPGPCIPTVGRHRPVRARVRRQLSNCPPIGAHQSPRPPLLRCRLASVWRQLSYAPPLVAHQSPHHHLFPSPPLISRPLHGHTRAGAHASGRAGERGPKRLTKISTHPHLLRHTRRRLGFSGSEAATEIREVSKPPFTRKIRQGEEIREGESPLTAAFHSQDPTRRRDPRRRARPEAAFDVAARSWPGAPGQPSGTCTHPPHRPGPARPGTGCVCVCLNTQYKSI